MTQRYTENAVKAKTFFAESFEASIELDRQDEKTRGDSDPRVEKRRRSLFKFVTAGLEPEPSQG